MPEETKRSGWIAVKRGIINHPIFHKRPDRLYVWLWMILTAAHKPTELDCDGKAVTVQRGQLLTSYRQMSEETGVGIQVIRTLLSQHRGDGAVNIATNTGRLLITICNYDKYQLGNAKGNTATNTGEKRSQHIKKQKSPSSNEEGPPSKEEDPIKVMFDSGVVLLGNAGFTEKKARSILGRWRKKHGTGCVIDAIGKALKESAVDPVAYIEGVFRLMDKTGAGLSETARARKIVQGM